MTIYAAWLLYNQNIYYAFLVGMIASLFDGADGLVARATKTTSIRGGYLDATLDRYADCIAFSAANKPAGPTPIITTSFCFEMFAGVVTVRK